MKALVLEGPGQLAVRDVPEPEPDSGDVLVSVEIAGFGGSETLALANPGIRPLPNVMGHGFAGKASDGRRVVVFYPLIPDEMSWRQASFVEPFANSIGAWDKALVRPDQRVLVIGAGGLGLGLVAQAGRSGLDLPPQIVEPSRARASAAEEMGAARCGGEGARRFDVAFDTVGSSDSRMLALRQADKGATVVLLGFAESSMDLPANELIRHEQRVVGSFVYSVDQFRRAVELARSVSDGFVTSLGWHEVRGALEAFQRGDHDIIKAAIRPQRTDQNTHN